MRAPSSDSGRLAAFLRSSSQAGSLADVSVNSERSMNGSHQIDYLSHGIRLKA